MKLRRGKITFQLLVLSLFLLTSVAWGQAGATEDHAGARKSLERGSTLKSAPQAAATETNGLNCGYTAMAFGVMSPGPTTVAAIRAKYPTSGLGNLTWTTRAGTGVYDYQTAGARALAPNSDGSGSLVLIDPPGGAFGNADDLTIDLVHPQSEFGFQIGDWGGPFYANLYFGSTPVGSVQVSTVGGAIQHYVSSTVPFNRIVLTALPDNPAANWVVPELELCQVYPVTTIPTLNRTGLVLIGLLLIGSAALLFRRRRMRPSA